MTFFALGADGAPVVRRDLGGDGQTQAVASAAGAGGVRPVEPLEHILLLLARSSPESKGLVR